MGPRQKRSGTTDRQAQPESSASSRAASTGLVRWWSKPAFSASALFRETVEILSRQPLIGRPIAPPLRERVISFGKTGYVP